MAVGVGLRGDRAGVEVVGVGGLDVGSGVAAGRPRRRLGGDVRAEVSGGVGVAGLAAQRVRDRLEVRQRVVGVVCGQPLVDAEGGGVELRRPQDLAVVVEVERLGGVSGVQGVLELARAQKVGVDVAVDRRVGVEALEEAGVAAPELGLVLGVLFNPKG